MSRNEVYELFNPLRHALFNAMNLSLDACDSTKQRRDKGRQDSSDETKIDKIVGEVHRYFHIMDKEAALLEKRLRIDPFGPWSLSVRIFLETRTYGRRLRFYVDGTPDITPWHGQLEEHETLMRLWDYIETVCHLCSPDDEKSESVSSVMLYDGKRPPVVCGRTKKQLNPTQYEVVKAVLDAGPTGLAGPSLIRQSSVTDAVNVLKRLARSDQDWASVIHLPGVAGKRYRIF